MLTIDGSFGEGGGQILRTALALSLVTGRPIRMERIRAGRKKPGLQRQHLTAVRAAAEISQAEVHGAALGSQRLTFVPREIRPGQYRFNTGGAGSTTLVLQTILPALWTAEGSSELMLEGGTHNPWAPPADFLRKSFLPLVNRMGPRIEVDLQRHGFYPAGGGLLTVSIEPSRLLQRLDVLERGQVIGRRVWAVVGQLPVSIAEREVRTILGELAWPEECGVAESVPSSGPGNAVTVEIQCEHVTEVCTGFGQKGVPAETVARGVAEEARRYLAAGAPVGEHLADQLLLPMALAGGGSFRTAAPSPHTRTNIDVIRQFLDVEIHTDEISPGHWQLTVSAHP